MTKGGSNSKLVEALAEELVKELKEQDAFNLSNNEDFQFFTDLLYEALDKKTDAEEKIGESVDEAVENQKETGDRLEALSQKMDEVRANSDDNAELLSMKDDDIMESVKGLQETVNGLIQKDKGDSKYIIAKDDIDEIKAVGRNTRSELEDINDRSAAILDHVVKNSKKQLRKIDRVEKKNENAIRRSRHKINRRHKLQIGHATSSIKRTIKTRFSKWWSRIKKLMLVASLFIFGPVIKKLIGAIVEKTQPLWQPVVDWFKTEFPQMTEFIKSIAASVGAIMDFIKPFVDYFAENTEDEVTAEDAKEIAEATIVKDEDGNTVEIKQLTEEERSDVAQARTEGEEEPGVLKTAAKWGARSAGMIFAAPLVATDIMREGNQDVEKAMEANEGTFATYDDKIKELTAEREQTTDPVRQAEIDALILDAERNKIQIENEIKNERGNILTQFIGRRKRNKRLEAATQAAADAHKAVDDMRRTGGSQLSVGAGAPEQSDAGASASVVSNTDIIIKNEIKQDAPKKRIR